MTKQRENGLIMTAETTAQFPICIYFVCKCAGPSHVLVAVVLELKRMACQTPMASIRLDAAVISPSSMTTLLFAFLLKEHENRKVRNWNRKSTTSQL